MLTGVVHFVRANARSDNFQKQFDFATHIVSLHGRNFEVPQARKDEKDATDIRENMRNRTMIKSHFCDGEGKRPRCDHCGLEGSATAGSAVIRGWQTFVTASKR